MSAHRHLFYNPDVTANSEDVSLGGEEHRHLSRVLRLRPGETAFVTNGTGDIFECRVQSVGRDATVLLVIAPVPAPTPARRVTLALACLQKDRFEQALEQATELGIERCVPFVAEGSHLKTYSANFLERLERIVLSACKQSFRAHLPPVQSPVLLEHVAEMCADYDVALVGEQDAPPLPSLSSQSSVLVVVGPEAGLTLAESSTLSDAGAAPASVSTLRLRAGTAATALVAAVLSR